MRSCSTSYRIISTREHFQCPMPVRPVYVDRLRVCCQRKLGWSPLAALDFFYPFKRRARGGLSVGELLAAVRSEHGDGVALVVLRALVYFQHEGAFRREHRRAFKRRA